VLSLKWLGQGIETLQLDGRVTQNA